MLCYKALSKYRLTLRKISDFLITFNKPAKQMLNETAPATLRKNTMKPSKEVHGHSSIALRVTLLRDKVSRGANS